MFVHIHLHPLIRIICLLCFIILLVQATPARLVIAASLLTVVYLLRPHILLKSAWRNLWRLRWLFLSILVLYLWLTPGQDLQYKLVFALHRITSLVLVVMAVTVLLALTTQQQLLDGLYRLLQPLRVVGLPGHIIVLRIMLTLRVVEQLQAYSYSGASGNNGSTIARLTQRIQSLIAYIEQQIRHAPLTPLQFQLSELPVWWQWGLPLLLVAMFLF